jgi:CemA family
MKLPSFLRFANQWFSRTPERALDQAYRAALKIKAIEDEHFNGEKISTKSRNYGNNTISYFKSDLNKYLNIIRVRLGEFKTSRSFVALYSPENVNELNGRGRINLERSEEFDIESQAILIEKLNFIDEIIAKYSRSNSVDRSVSLIPLSQNQVVPSNPERQVSTNTDRERSQGWQREAISQNNSLESMSDKTGAVPRSIIRTVNRIQKELDPKAEEEVVKKFRNSRDKTIISIKFILTLIIVPILTQQIAKTFVVGPIVEKYRSHIEPVEFLNINLEEEFVEELERYEQKLHFQSLLLVAPEISHEEMEAKVREKAQELNHEYQERGTNSVKNVFSDLTSLIAFGVILVTKRAELTVLKSFMDDIVYGLSDSAKAFIIILFTDMFVGFHSPHGWEVILEAVSRHLGIPENHDFIFLFIATFPVILDSVIKYWIFRYLNRISPSAVATYKNMNE